MKLSIVVPTYNQGPYIKDCLCSIQGQSLKELEVIIQDSCSTDDTQTICEDFCKRDPRFKYFREKDSGQTDALNRGLKRSSGKYWTWICSDDFYLNNQCLEALITPLDSQTPDDHYVGAFGNAKYTDEKGSSLYGYHKFSRNLEELDLQHDWPISQPSSLLLKGRLDEIGPLRTELYLGMDLDLFLRMLKGGRRFKYVDIDVAGVRLQGDSKSVRLREKTATNALDIIEGHFGNIGSIRRSAYVMQLTHLMFERFGGNLKIHNKISLVRLRRKMLWLDKKKVWWRKLGTNTFLSKPVCIAFDWTSYHILHMIPYYVCRLISLTRIILKWKTSHGIVFKGPPVSSEKLS